MAEDESFCLFHCDSLPMAVAVAHVAEIAEVDALVRISLCPPRVAGLCPYHRQVVPVVALGKSPFRADLPMIDQRNAGKSTKEIVLIMQTSQGLWGILIDREGTFLTTQRPSRHEPRDEGDGIVSEGRIDHGGKTYALLEAESTWRGLRTGCQLVCPVQRVDGTAAANQPGCCRQAGRQRKPPVIEDFEVTPCPCNSVRSCWERCSVCSAEE